MSEELLAKWRQAQNKLQQAKDALDDFQQFITKFQEEQTKIAEKLQFPSVAGLDQEVFKQFFNQPYLLMPRRQDSWYVIVPKFVDMQLGWLEWTTPCYDSETRVLTRKGFKFFKDLTFEDELFTLNRPMNRMEYKKPTLIHHYTYDEKMVHFEGESIDLLVTPNHKVLVAGANTRKSMRSFHLMEARNLLHKQDYTYQMLRAGKIWRGRFKDSNGIHFHRGEPKTVSIPQVADKSHAKCLRNTSRISLNSFIKLFAWWITEGSVFESTSAGYSQYRNSIANQSTVNLLEISNSVAEIGFSPVHNNSEKAKSVSFSSKQFFFFLSQFGKAHDKFIPEALKNLPQPYLRLLFDTMMKGDGSRRGDAYHTVSKKLAGDVAEIALKLSYGVSITFLADHGTKGIFHVSFSKRKKSPKCRKPTLEDYIGDVYCVTIPNHIILVERNGKTCWSGNSYNVFVINKYVRWMAPLPHEIEERLGPTPATQAKVVDGLLKVSAGMEDQAWQRYRKYLYKRDQFGIRIKKGYERHLLSSLIQDGYLPFTPRSVEKEDLQPAPIGFEPLPHQKEALDQWFQWGAVGIYWPGGMGKTYMGAAICGMVKGKKLVVVPNITEKEQWRIYLNKFNIRDIQLETYSAWHKVQGKDYTLIIYDECLPWETIIATEIGEIPIGEIVKNFNGFMINQNPQVWSYNFHAQRFELKPILSIFIKETQELIEVTTNLGTNILLTPTHKVYTISGKQLPAERLKEGMKLAHLPDLSKIISEISIPCSSYSTSQIPRTQQDDRTEISLESPIPREMENIPLTNSGESQKREKWALERWKTHLEKNRLRGFEATSSVHGLHRESGSENLRYSSQRWHSLKQFKRKSNGSVPKLPREPTPRGRSNYIKVDCIERIERIEVAHSRVYDIEVKDNHNFFANNLLVSNCHRLPAPVWSRFATVDSKYRLGFSATPYREDGREDLIIALTGYPIGLSWEHFLQAKAIRKPRIICKLVTTDREKLSILEDLLKIPMKTLIFVELQASGEKIAKHFNIPFVYGNTKDRLETINKNLITVVSRVGDEGISIKDLERTIEVEFLGGSRRQEAQRAYRLLHSVKPEISHTIIMTVNELDQFGRRFLALEEKGFKIEYVT